MALDARDVVLSFYRLRQALGWLGLALPVLLIGATLARGDALPPALSDFYFTPLRDVFVGILCAIGLFLLTYLGHRAPLALLSDRNVSTLAGLGALGIALFPNDPLDPCAAETIPSLSLVGAIHTLSAGSFLLMTALFCLVLFRRSDRALGALGAAKRQRNAVYLACGLAILGALGLLGLYFLALDPAGRCALRDWRPVLWLEVVTIVAFGVAWLVKGRAIVALNDPGPPPPPMGEALAGEPRAR